MDTNLLEQLLYEEESDTLDFKQEQYPFRGADDTAKSELLKDILGFANAWRRSDAYILIGVEEVRGGRSVVHGVSEHLEDHDLQQFVTSKTNVPLQVSYEVCSIEGKQVGVIRIPQQPRPLFLKKDYGKLKKNLVYVRRGSSTDINQPATPDEIAKMGLEVSGSVSEVELDVEFAEIEREVSLGTSLDWEAERLELPEEDKIPLVREQKPAPMKIGGHIIQPPDLSSIRSQMNFERLNSTFYREYGNYELHRRLVKPMRLVVTNTGEKPVEDVQIEITVPSQSGIWLFHQSEIPDKPQLIENTLTSQAMRNFVPRKMLKEPGDVYLESTDHQAKLQIECGVLQPGRKIWTDDFLIGIYETGTYSLDGLLYSSSLSKPKEFSLTLNAEIAKKEIDVSELKEMANADTDDE